MATTRQEYETSIINSLKISDPAMNTGLGTPVRKIISAVAAEIADYSTEQDKTQTLYAIESVSGTELDALVAQFGFTRQEARAAHGTITVSRDNGDNALQISYGSQFYKPSSSTSNAIYFQTTAYQELAEGVLSADIAVTAVSAGTIGNVAAGTITYSPTYNSYISVTNENPTTGGRDAETDAELRKRFLETVFRNVSGTKDQYLGLALAHLKNNRANIIGRSTTYSEIVQVKKSSAGLYVVSAFSDECAKKTSETTYEQTAIDLDRRFWLINQDSEEIIERAYFTVSFNGAAGTYKATFKTNNKSEVFGPSEYGGTYQLSHGSVYSVTSITLKTSGNKLLAGVDYTYDATTGLITFAQEAGASQYFVVGDTFTVTYKYYPVAENDFIRIEFDYLSTINRGGLKTVELYIDGSNEQKVSDIQYINFNNALSEEMVSEGRWLREDGTEPSVGNIVVPLSYQPLEKGNGNGEANIGTSIVLQEGHHFNYLRDQTTAAGSEDAADAIELIGVIYADTDSGTRRFRFSNDTDTTVPNDTPMNIPYYYNDVVETVQDLIDAQSVVTMDTKVHAAKRRYFGIYLTVMYSSFPRASITELIEENIIEWAESLPFGSEIQFSDIETVAANTIGVDNVRISLQDKDSASDFGIVEYQQDGSTIKQRYVSDFGLRQNEIFEVQFVEVLARSQQDW